MSLADRKPVQRPADIPPDVLRALNEGHIESIYLAEWYVIDYRLLMRTVLPQVGLDDDIDKADSLYKRFAE